jgi:hypothetical protein
MDVVGAIGGATGAALWAVAGTRLVSRMRPARQMSAFTIGAVVCALAGGLFGSAVSKPNRSAAVAVVRTVASDNPTTDAFPAPPSTTTTMAITTTTVAPLPTTTTAAAHNVSTTPTTRRRTATRSIAPAPAPSQPVTARCADGWGIYGRNRSTHACDTHGGVAYWIVEPTN